MRIVFSASEAVPFAKTGGLADVAGALPLALEKLGHEVVICLPRYKMIRAGKFKIKELKEDISCAQTGENIKAYFIENGRYFNRDGLYGNEKGDYKDNLERFSFYCRRVLRLLKEIDFRPDIIHLHDWQAALIPVYLKAIYKNDTFYRNVKTVLTIHNLGYQGIFPEAEYIKLGLDESLFNMEMLEFYGKINLLKGGIIFSDFITTVSPTYSRQIQTKEWGFGLEGVLAKRRQGLFGIVNGIDYSIWNPRTDKFIAKNYSLTNIKDKLKNKENLQKSCRFPVLKNIPLLGVVSRLAEQKGIDILTEALDEILQMNLQLVILGAGDEKYHIILKKIASKYPKEFSLHLEFNDPLAHNIYAGSDIFLMPSKYEPCGLGQMISLSYGTVPLVYKTGGLADTVTPEYGFLFDQYEKKDLIKAVSQALEAYQDNKRWDALVRRAMQCNFSWDESAKNYAQVYQRAVSP